MTTRYSTAEQHFEQLDDDTLLSVRNHYQQCETDCRALRERAEYEILRRMQERNATELAAGPWRARLEPPTPRYDMNAMQTLKEHVSAFEWSQAWIPEKTVVTPGKLNLVKAKAWLRRGKEIQDIFDKARLPSTPSVLKIWSARHTVAGGKAITPEDAGGYREETDH